MSKLTATMEPIWSPSSWRKFPVKQQAKYKDLNALKSVELELKALPPLVTVREVEALKAQLGEVAQGKCFLLQGGDCAERFLDCNASFIEKKLRILLQMSLVITWGAKTPVVRIGRMAGQYSKPRSKDMEYVENFGEIPSFRGDNINGFAPCDREPNPSRLTKAYFHSASTLNYMRALLDSGFADLHDAKAWDVGFVKNIHQREKYEAITKHLIEAMDFMNVVGADKDPSLGKADIYTSHEGLHLPYEESMTYKVGDKWYNLGAHFLWIGDRTRQLDHAHVEYFRGISNPMGIKVGPTSDPDEIVKVVHALWSSPESDPGRITLITRMGANKTAELLPKVIEAVQMANLPVVWQCDPMHGNTSTSSTGLKTRDLGAVLKEIRLTMETHKAMGSILGGVHLELTGENVTECTGGPEELTDLHLPHCYTTYCDPRLNYAQSLEVAFMMTAYINNSMNRKPLQHTNEVNAKKESKCVWSDLLVDSILVTPKS